MPRKHTTGRFKNRLTLAEWVWVQWICTTRNQHQIAVDAEVSDATVQKLLTNGEGRDTAKYYPEKSRKT